MFVIKRLSFNGNNNIILQPIKFVLINSFRWLDYYGNCLSSTVRKKSSYIGYCLIFLSLSFLDEYLMTQMSQQN